MVVHQDQRRGADVERAVDHLAGADRRITAAGFHSRSSGLDDAHLAQYQYLRCRLAPPVPTLFADFAPCCGPQSPPVFRPGD